MRGLRRGRIVEAQLNPGAAVPVVQLQLSGQMEPQVAGILQRRAQRTIEGPEGNRVQRRPGAIADRKLEMAVADPAGVDLGIGKGKARGGGGGTEGTGVLDLFDKGDGCGACGQKAVDSQVLRAT